MLSMRAVVCGAAACALVALTWRSSFVAQLLGLKIQIKPPSPRFASDGTRIFSAEELAAYDGQTGTSIYISILGHVFDVTEGKQHYTSKGAYHHFAGRDATRSFVTGEKAKDKLTDDLDGLGDESLEEIATWYRFYDEHPVYRRVGRLVGRYYDPESMQTVQYFPFKELADAKAKKDEQQQKQAFPSCNSKWSQAEGSEVWCSFNSGGIEREWVGVPRLYKPEGTTNERCACVPIDQTQSIDLRLYPGCDQDAEWCKVDSRQ